MKILDPKAFFLNSLLQGKDPRNYEQALREVAPTFYKYGFGHSIDSSGKLRGRIFLPHAAFRNCAPRLGEEKWGVAQDTRAWEHQVDIINAEATQWIWKDLGGPEYVPLEVTENGDNIDSKIPELLLLLVGGQNLIAEKLDMILVELSAQREAVQRVADNIEKEVRDGVKIRFR